MIKIKTNKMTLEQKINYLEKKFNAPMDIIMQVINHCEKIGIGVDKIELK